MNNDIFVKSKDCLKKIELDEVYFFTKVNTKTFAVLKDEELEIGCSLYSLYEILRVKSNFLGAIKVT